MVCPRCNSERTRLSWLREFAVLYWCTECHADFEIDRARRKGWDRPKGEAKTSLPPAAIPQ